MDHLVQYYTVLFVAGSLKVHLLVDILPKYHYIVSGSLHRHHHDALESKNRSDAKVSFGTILSQLDRGHGEATTWSSIIACWMSHYRNLIYSTDTRGI